MISLEAFENLSAAPVGAFVPKPTSLTEGQTEALNVLWVSENKKTSIGVWECTPGRFSADRTAAGEYCHIISGRATVSNSDGTVSREICTGDLLVLPQSWTGEWTIHEHMRKLFIISETAAE